MDAGQQASATQGSQPHGRTEASNFPLVATGLDIVDENRLVAIRSTVSALQKVRYLSPLAPSPTCICSVSMLQEEGEVTKRIQEKAVVQLQDKVELVSTCLCRYC